MEKITSEIVLRTFFGYEEKECLKIGDQRLSVVVS